MDKQNIEMVALSIGLKVVKFIPKEESNEHEGMPADPITNLYKLQRYDNYDLELDIGYKYVPITTRLQGVSNQFIQLLYLIEQFYYSWKLCHFNYDDNGVFKGKLIIWRDDNEE